MDPPVTRPRSVRPSRPPPPVDSLGRNIQSINDLLRKARNRLHDSVELTNSPGEAVASLGGCERACTLLMLASLDPDADGQLSAAELERYGSVGRQLVESAKSFHLNTGVVSALVLSVVFGIAYEEDSVLEHLGTRDKWDHHAFVDLTSNLALQLAVALSFVTVMASSRLYTQLAFWMPNLELQLWFINESSVVTSSLETCKNVTLFMTLLALSLETAVTSTWLDVVAFLPLVIGALGFCLFEVRLSRMAVAQLGKEIVRSVRGSAGSSRGAGLPYRLNHPYHQPYDHEWPYEQQQQQQQPQQQQHPPARRAPPGRPISARSPPPHLHSPPRPVEHGFDAPQYGHELRLQLQPAERHSHHSPQRQRGERGGLDAHSRSGSPRVLA